MRKDYKKWMALLLATATVVTTSYQMPVDVQAEAVVATNTKVAGFNNGNATSLDMELIARYNSGTMNADGGALEIVDYNTKNGYAYAVSGVNGTIIAVKISDIAEGDTVADLAGTSFDVSVLVNTGLEGFTYGDVTSVAVSPDGTKLAAAVQHADYDKNGAVAIFSCNEDGSLTNPQLIPVGVQPDMVTYTPDGSKILTANEGEPRQGYATGNVDPQGTVSVIKTADNTVTTADFTAYDAAENRAALVNAGVVLKKDAAPSADLEPEYITTTDTTAYVTLQEANAVAALDLATGRFTGVYPLGTVDYSAVAIDLDKQDKAADCGYTPANYADVLGLRMPDGIASYVIGSKTYIITANEGDSREWGVEGTDNYYTNEDSKKLTSTTGTQTGKKVTFLDSTKCDGLTAGKTYLYGTRSYSIFEATAAGLNLVYDSANDFEKLTAQYLPQYFNSSNDEVGIDDRSNKKGPEAESVTVGQVGDKTYAYVTLERIGGVMVYDITNPAAPVFQNYMNSRDFSADIKGDDSPEGIHFVPATDSSKAMLLAACEVSGTLAVYELTEKQDDIVVLYTNDVHNAYEIGADVKKPVTKSGYAELAYEDKSLTDQGYKVTMIDAGDALQGGTIGTLSKGSYIVDIMNEVGYDIAVPGNHEFDYGMDNFLSLAKDRADFTYISSNFSKLSDSTTVFPGYEMVDYGDVDVAYVGITTPETFSKSTPTYFQDANGNYIYSFAEGNNGQDLYQAVQTNVDAAKAAGAEYVVAVGHIGTDESSEPWTSTSIISNTTGINAFIDGHSHSTIEQRVCQDKDGKNVILSSTGSQFADFGKMTIKADGTITTELVDTATYANQDAATLTYLNSIKDQFAALENQKVATTAVDLIVNENLTGDRLVRNQETNLGDLCADAYRDQMKADIAFVNGGGVRANLKAGDITYGNIVSVHPYGNMACLIEATGQQILDALELGARATATGESGGFLQVSGLTYEIDTTIPSSVKLKDNGEFVSVDGAYRVNHVLVGGKALDLTKTYKLASHNYMLKSGGDGYTMFKGNKILLDETLIDNQVLINYITDTLGGTIAADSIYSNQYGEGRIKVILSKKEATTQAEGYREILRGTGSYKETIAKLPTAAPEKKEYTVTLKQVAGGKITSSAAKTTDGTKVTITATPAAGYKFVSWSVVSGGAKLASVSSSTTTYTMPKSAVTITAKFEKKLAKNAAVTSGRYKYKVSNSSTTGKGTVTLTGFTKGKSTSKVIIPSTIKANGITYKVTAIASKAFDKNRKIKSVVIGKNVTTIGASAFNGDTKLKSVTFKGTTLKKVGSSAFKNTYSKMKIKVPAKKVTAYKKLLKNKGVSSKAKITK